MTTLQKGQLSYLILSCLVEKDMYGLELIEEIKKRSGVEVKLPSLYSNLNRMKELKFISSYLKESTKGPKCAYSSITENGRKEFEKLKESFGSQSFISEDVEAERIEHEPFREEIKEQEEIAEQIDEIKKDENYDDFFAEIPDKDEENEESAIENVEEVKEETKEAEKNNEEVLEKEDVTEADTSPVLENSVDDDLEDDKEEGEEEIKNDAVFLSNEERHEQDAHEYNKKIFDVSMDYNKNKNRKSFSENQIEMVVKDAVPVEEKREKTITNVNSLKEALLQSRQGNYENVVLPTAPVASHVQDKKEEMVENTEVKDELFEEKVFDDGKFITDRVDYIPKAKRFEPPKINLLVPSEEEPLPAPKRNANLDPNCSDIRAKIESLYALSRNNVSTPSNGENHVEKAENTFDNFEDLKDYYDTQNISFKVYKRAEKKVKHNTNKIIFFVDLITLGLIAFGSALFYLIFSLTGLTNPNTNFLYYLLPILYFVYVGIRFYMYKRISSKVPRPLFNFIVVWGSAILLSGVVFCLNLASGVPVNALTPCISSIVLPIFVIFVIFIFRHYAMLFSLKRYWK